MIGDAFGKAWIAMLRWAFWLLYNPLAWTYESVSRVVSLGQWRRWQLAGLAGLRGARVLELGFGTGDMLRELGSRGFVPVGLDLSPWMVRLARRAVGPQVPLVRGRAQQLPFGDDSFDSVLCTFPAGFILAPETFREVARVLCPGGRVVVVMAAQLLGSDPASRLLERLYRITGQRGVTPDLDTRLAREGLEGRLERVRVGRSLVSMVVAEKTD